MRSPHNRAGLLMRLMPMTFARVVGFLVGMISAGALAGTVTYYHNDLVGSPVVATNASGQVIWRESYRPFGERLTNAAASANNDVWFTSRRQDVDTGLVYMGARYYDPVVGRFISKDPAGFDEGNIHSFNRYAYANNNPYRYVDPNGRNALEVIAIGALLFILVEPRSMQEDQARSLAQFIGKVRGMFQEEGDKNADTKPKPGAKRPEGVPEEWREEPTRNGDGTQWINPENSGDRVRSMPGDPTSPHPSQKRPYVRDVRNGNQWLDVNGNRVEGKEGRNSPDTHIPAEDYKFRP